MSDEEEAYCRLCAEPTTKETLISPDEDAGINSNIKTKMLWINIDITTSNLLPKSICFSCFDALERTWSFLHNVRTAQNKLKEIFMKNSGEENSANKIATNQTKLIGKPMNVDWEQWENQDIKPNIDELLEVTVDPNSFLSLEIERLSPDDDCQEANDTHHEDDDDSNHETDDDSHHEVVVNVKREAKDTTDTEGPYMTAKNTKVENKKRKDGNKISVSSSFNNQAQSTWDDYRCQCAVCDTQCLNIVSLRLHSLQMHGYCCKFKCIECGKVINKFKTFINHVRLHSFVLKFCCEFCSKFYKKMTHLKKHRNNEHHNAYRTMCQTCGVKFETEVELQEHKHAYTKKKRKRAPNGQKTEVLLKCEQCDKEFRSRTQLKRHTPIHTDRTRSYSCRICAKQFYTNSTLYTHIFTHDEKKRFKCDTCGMTFRKRGNLTAHIGVHSNIKPFVCEKCGKNFRTKKQLESHSIVHTDLMPYSCQYCNKRFKFKTRLSLHLRQHTGAKPYRCDYCVRNFTNGSNYKKHMMRRHNIDTSPKKHFNNLGVVEPKFAEGTVPDTNQTQN